MRSGRPRRFVRSPDERGVQRLDLDSYEASKQRLTEIRQAEADAKREAEVSTDSVKTSRGGRPAKGSVSKREVSRRTGIPEQTIRDTERHIEAAELAVDALHRVGAVGPGPLALYPQMPAMTMMMVSSRKTLREFANRPSLLDAHSTAPMGPA
jgi:hypothetical protein